MKVLAIDTSNQTLSVSVCDGPKLLGHYSGTTNKNHSISLMPAIDFIMKENKISPKELERIVVAEGPGSYTGLRIGVTTAKTLAWTLGIELVGVSSLAAIAANSIDYTGYLIPLFDARRQNVYTGVYQWQAGKLVTVIADQHISLEQWLAKVQTLNGELRFIGQDVANFQEQLTAYFPESSFPMSPQINEVNSVSLAQLGLQAQVESNIADFVPKYLKLVEAEEVWLATHQGESENHYVEKI